MMLGQSVLQVPGTRLPRHTRLCSPNLAQRAMRQGRRCCTAPSAIAAQPQPGLARRILSDPAIEGDPMGMLAATEAYWKALRQQKHEPQRPGPKVVRTSDTPMGAAPEYDAVMCGGTLGLLLALSLQLQGHKVAIVERRLVKGRTQEWNSSRPELQTLVSLGLLTEAELEASIVTEFNPIRVGFKGGKELWVRDTLNIGVDPSLLLEHMKQRFLEAGGTIFEHTQFKGADVHPDGISIRVGPAPGAPDVGDANRPTALGGGAGAGTAPSVLRSRMIIDCMGHYSPIVKQIRGKAKPDGMCLVVGSCAEGFPSDANNTADLLYTVSDAGDMVEDMQLFWEAFPAAGGASRTTYMFAYADADPARPSFEHLLDAYFSALPGYQGVDLEDLRFQRVLFGGFPCYASGPLAPAFDRILQIGDASASQSPLSFGGFGSMLRHISRLSRAVDHSLRDDCLSKAQLGLVQPYQPALSAAWLFARSMSVGVGQLVAKVASTMSDAAADWTAATASSSSSGFGDEVEEDDEEEEPYRMMPGGMVVAAATFSVDESVDAGVVSPRPASRPGSAAGTHRRKRTSGSRSPSPQPRVQQVQQRLQQHKQQGQQQDQERQDGAKAAKHGWMPRDHICRVLACNFGVMALFGDRVLKPFLQDTIQLLPLTLTMTGMMVANPIAITRVLAQIGPKTVLSWFRHYTMLVVYTLLHCMLKPIRPLLPKSFRVQRWLEALQYGAGLDYTYHAAAA